MAEGAERTVKMIKDAGKEASCLAADVSISRQVEMMVSKTVDTYGRLDCTFNNAGIEGEFGDTTQCIEENVDRVIANRSESHLALPEIRDPANGSSRVAARSLTRPPSLACWALPVSPPMWPPWCGRAYTDGRTRIRPKTHSRVIRTPMVERALDSGGLTEAEVIAGEPVGRLGKPEEIAEGVLWLLSDAVRHRTPIDDRRWMGGTLKQLRGPAQETEMIMARLLAGKVVLVTGGGSGIGRATSILLAKEGAKVMIADYVPEGAERPSR